MQPLGHVLGPPHASHLPPFFECDANIGAHHVPLHALLQVCGQVAGDHEAQFVWPQRPKNAAGQNPTLCRTVGGCARAPRFQIQHGLGELCVQKSPGLRAREMQAGDFVQSPLAIQARYRLNGTRVVAGNHLNTRTNG